MVARCAAFWFPWRRIPRRPSPRKNWHLFARELLDHALGRLPEIDALLAAALQKWDLRRLGAVDRAILRLAVAEMLARPDIPPAVTINEAIEIARNLATAESARFANGVLDRVRKEIGRDSHAAS
jgi:N utilization substance protein B